VTVNNKHMPRKPVANIFANIGQSTITPYIPEACNKPTKRQSNNDFSVERQKRRKVDKKIPSELKNYNNEKQKCI